MTVKALTIQAPPVAGGSLEFADERERAAKGECDEWAVASLTISEKDDDRCGEFLDLADVQKLHDWTGKLLAEERRGRERTLAGRLTGIV